MFKYIIRPLAILRIANEEFYYKREPNRKKIEDNLADCIMMIMLLMEIIVLCFIGRFLDPFHIPLAVGVIVMAFIMYTDKRLAIRILRSPRYTHKIDELYPYFASLPIEQRRYFNSWKYWFKNLFPILIISAGTLIISLLLILKIFPR